jgi:hypothetical protein
MFLTTQHNLTAEIAYRHERIAADWAAVNAGRTKRPARRRPRWTLPRLRAHRTGTVSSA